MQPDVPTYQDQPAPVPFAPTPVPQNSSQLSGAGSELAARLKEAKNVLVTVSKNPSVDQLSAAIGLTIALNRLDKHATAVYSGETPSTLEFLKPADTLEKTTDSLRDFIIALDKSKADKLRYKVEDQVVRIFITPYHTAISQDDLDFSQGDFNVDVVVALGVQSQQDIDNAVVANGRILHDATVATISLNDQSEFGSINWVDSGASSLSELSYELVEDLNKQVIDTQVATAFLTGIVATTERFSNERTTPKTMSASAALMAAGANQQLIATELATPVVEPEEPVVPAQTEDTETSQEVQAPVPPVEPGVLEIAHEANSSFDTEPAELPAVSDEPSEPQIHVDQEGMLSILDTNAETKQLETLQESAIDQPEAPKISVHRDRLADEPSFDTPITANTEVEPLGPNPEDASRPVTPTPILSHNEHVLPTESGAKPALSPMPLAFSAENMAEPQAAEKTLAELEQEVNSPHLHSAQSGVDGVPSSTSMLGSARDAANAAAPPPNSFPGAPVVTQGDTDQPAPPPVPPPMIPPLAN